jgi:hypothetical protein
MYNGLLHLHNLLRWIILVLLLLSLSQAFAAKAKPAAAKRLQKTSLFLLISAHITLLIGLYQWFAGELGFKMIRQMGFSAIMKDSNLRFWAVEHITGMVVAIILITIARSKVKRAAFGAASWLYVIALIIILASVPWPFREGIGRPWFPGMH